MSSNLSNVWEKWTFQIRQNYRALVGFLPEPDFCWIWKKCRIPAGAGADIRYSPSYDGGLSSFVVMPLSAALVDPISSIMYNVNLPVCISALSDSGGQK